MKKRATEMTTKELAKFIDQSVLKPEFTEQEIRRYIQEGIDFGCATVCINPSVLDIASEMTRGTDTKICVVCDFPFGSATTVSKATMAEEYCKRGDVYELDMVANYGWIRSGKWKKVEADIKAVVEACHKYGVEIKVIIETDMLSDEEIIRSTEVVISSGADFVKSSTGFAYTINPVGAAIDVIRLMMDTSKGLIKVKGSGCIRTRDHFLELIDMGIDRMGIGYKSTPIVLGLHEAKKC